MNGRSRPQFRHRSDTMSSKWPKGRSLPPNRWSKSGTEFKTLFSNKSFVTAWMSGSRTSKRMPISLSGRPRVSSRGTCLPAGRAALGAMDGPVVARERIAITLGDAAGIGPEVTLKAVHSVRRNLNAQILLLGRASFFHGLSKRLRLKMRFKDIADPADWAEDPSVLCCYSHGSMPAKVIRGKFSAALTKIAVRSIELAA